MKAVALFAGLLLSAVAACVCVQAADGLPVLRGDHTKPVATGEDLLPAAPSVSDTRANTPPVRAAARAPAAARRAPAQSEPTRAAGGDATGDGAARLPEANNRAPAQPLRARPVLSWQSLLPGSIQ
ncbi:hypothetical protein [Metallibacterium sp.]|uniref:hypothetical protein n=1 Tax=Metallibacterium sp. TaxID=2940281 RepID=UPI002609670C|nr:hypothetical protein [Metallibacterium sp.]